MVSIKTQIHDVQLEQIISDFINSNQPTLAICGMAELLPNIEESLSQTAERDCIDLAPNVRLTNNTSESIYNHLYTSSSNSNGSQEPNDTGKAEHIFELRENNDSKDCIYLLNHAHLLSNAKFITPDGKQYGSGVLLEDFFTFADFENTERKAIFFGDPYQIQRGNALSRCTVVYTIPLQDPNTPNLPSRLKNQALLAQAIHYQEFASLPLVADDNILIQDDNKSATTKLLSDYQNNNHGVWYLAETHYQTQKLTDWLRKKLFDSPTPPHLVEGDWVEIYAWGENSPENPSINPPPYTKDLYSVEQACKPIPQGQELKGRSSLIPFHTLRCQIESFTTRILLEFLTETKAEMNIDTAIAINVWQKSKNLRLSLVRYGYAATVHHAQGMKRDICYINCDHSAGKHSEVFFRWLYSALTTANEKITLLNFTPIHPFDQAVWNTQTVQITPDPESIRIGSGWSWFIEDNESNLQQYLFQVAAQSQCGCTFDHLSSHAYQEQYQVNYYQGNFILRITYNNKKQVTALHTNLAEMHWEVLSTLAQSLIMNTKYSKNTNMLINFLIQRLGPYDWKTISAISKNDYRLHITLARKYNERVHGEINFNQQGLVSSIQVLSCTDYIFIDELKGLLS